MGCQGARWQGATTSNSNAIARRSNDARGGESRAINSLYRSDPDLAQRVRDRGPLPPADAVRHLREVAWALAYAHARGVIHRDVKAENVLFDDSERPLLADFGIALRRGFGPRVTAAGLAVGSTAYMAPEQARGEEVDGRADLYSLGVMTWEMQTGSKSS